MFFIAVWEQQQRNQETSLLQTVLYIFFYGSNERKELLLLEETIERSTALQVDLLYERGKLVVVYWNKDEGRCDYSLSMQQRQ